MDFFSHSDFSINRHFQRSIRIDNDITKEFLEHFILHDTGKKVLNQIATQIFLQFFLLPMHHEPGKGEEV